MDFWDYKYLNIPINADGVCVLDGNIDGNWDNVCSIKLTKEDIENLNNLINVLNLSFGILIDLSEEERLLYTNLQPALIIAERHYKEAPDDAKLSIQKVIDAINAAIGFKTFVEFDL